jgi:hypothetical protein
MSVTHRVALVVVALLLQANSIRAQDDPLMFVTSAWSDTLP